MCFALRHLLLFSFDSWFPLFVQNIHFFVGTQTGNVGYLCKVWPCEGSTVPWIGWWRGTPTYNGGNKDKETSDIYKILVYIGFIYSCFRKLRERGRVFLSLAFFLLRCLSFIWCESLKQKKAGKIFDMISWACLRDNFELGKFILTSRITFSIPAAPNVPDKYGQTIRPSYRGVCRTGWL